MQGQTWWIPLGAAGIALISALLATWLTHLANRKQEELRWQREREREDIRWKRSQLELGLKLRHEVDVQWRADRSKIYSTTFTVLEAWHRDYEMWESVKRGDIVGLDEATQKKKLIEHHEKFSEQLGKIQIVASPEVVDMAVQMRNALSGAHLVIEPGWADDLDFKRAITVAAKRAAKVVEITGQLVLTMRADLQVESRNGAKAS